MIVATTKKSWIQIQLNDPALAGVTVHHEDGDTFALTKQMIARSGQIAAQVIAINRQLNALRVELGQWAFKHAKAIDRAFLALRGDHFLFLAVLKAKGYDSLLEDDLTELDMRVAQNSDYDQIRLSVLSLPACAEDVIRSFLPHPGAFGDVSEHAE